MLAFVRLCMWPSTSHIRCRISTCYIFDSIFAFQSFFRACFHPPHTHTHTHIFDLTVKIWDGCLARTYPLLQPGSECPCVLFVAGRSPDEDGEGRKVVSTFGLFGFSFLFNQWCILYICTSDFGPINIATVQTLAALTTSELQQRFSMRRVGILREIRGW